jgi:hypothetical protein
VQVRWRRATNSVVSVLGGVFSVAAMVIMLVVSVALANALDDVSKDLDSAANEALSTAPTPAAAVEEPTTVERPLPRLR